MSQHEDYTRRQSYSSNSSNSNQPRSSKDGVPTSNTSPKSNHRYSSSAYSQPRHYASPEESDAVLPIFSTPTHMYIKQQLNFKNYNTSSPKQQYAPSPVQTHYSATQEQQQHNQNTTNGPQQQSTTNGYYEANRNNTPGSPLSNKNQYGKTRGEPSPTRPSMDNFGMNSMENEINNMNSGRSNNNRPSNATASPPKSTPEQDMLLAQLVDMGFTLEVSRIAMIASGGTNLQEILDILIQQADSQPTNRQNTPVNRQNPPIPPPHSSRPDLVPPTRPEPVPPTRPDLVPPTRPEPVPPTRPEPVPPTRPSQPSNINTTATPVPPVRPSSSNPVPPPPRNNKNSDDEGEDPSLEKEREAQFKKEQEERRKEYLEQLKREKPTPPTPSPRPPPKSPPKSTTTTSDPATFFADKERKQGNFLFNKNQFPEAEAAYTLAIDALPPGHSELVLLSNNRAAARLKQNKYHECLSDCSVAIDVARKQMALHSSDTTWKSQMIKALHRKACALEGLRLYEAAIQVYEEYVRMDGSRSAQVSQGIIRCQQALLNNKKQPPPQPPRPANGPSWKPTNDMSAFPDIDFNMFIPKQTAEQKANLEEINKSKAVKEMRDREKKKEAEEAERLSKVDKVGAQISVWKTGKDRNLRALLGSLELILWPGVQWKGVTMGELLEPRKCKIAYMKAIAKVHPDKLPANATVEQRMLASGIFTTLNQAWDIFKTENNL